MRHLIKLLVPTIAASLLLAACGSSSSKPTASAAAKPSSSQTSSPSNAGETSSAVVKTASSKLGTILVDNQGMTLYHLGGEQNGKFICTSSTCTGVWHPLVASSGAAPTGVSSLGTVKRPEGTLQVTYKGAPLYTFAEDRQPGEVKGQGIKDVGTWSVITTGSAGGSGTSATPAATAPATSTPPAEKSAEPASGGGYGY